LKQFKVGVIAAAGKGTRAYPRTSFIPKPLFRIEGKSILHHNIELMKNRLGVQTIYILVGHLKEQVIEEIGAIRNLVEGVNVIHSPWTTKGLASDIASLEDKINEPFITILGDEFYYHSDHERLLDIYNTYSSASCLIGVIKTSVLSRIRKNYSVELVDGNRISNLVEKPNDPPNQFLGLGTYIFTPQYFSFFKKTPPSPKTGVIEITEVIDKMAKETKQVYAAMLNCEYVNINSMQDYHQAVYQIRNDKFSQFTVSLVVPTYNNSRSISDVLHDFQDKVNESIVIDAGSTDNTLEIVNSFQTQVLNYKPEIQKGFVGEQVRLGIEKAKGDIVIIVSPTAEFRSKDYPKLLEYMKDSDMVIGTRTTRQMIEQGSNLRPLPRLINLVMGKLVEVFWWSQEPRFTDVDCRYMAIWKDSYNKIKDSLEVKGKTYTVEMMIEIVRSHMRCIEIPVSYYKPVESEKYSLREAIKDAWTVLKIITKKKWN